jgi:hypothetical protein
MRHSLNKKGEGVTNNIWHVIMEIAVIALIILLFFSFSSKLYGAVFGSNGDKNTIKLFNALADNIQLMADRLTEFESQTMTFYLDEDHYVFGFQDSGTLSRYGYSASDYPNACNNGPCLCLYEDLSNVPKDPVKCKNYNSNIVFHGLLNKNRIVEHVWIVGRRSVNVIDQPHDLYSDYPAELVLGYQYLILGMSNDKTFWNLYVEKFTSGDRIHIFMTSNLSQSSIDKRVALLSVCPDNSDAGCSNVPINSNIGAGFCYFDEIQQRCILKQGVTDCPPNTRITETCACGSRLIDLYIGDEKYCYRANDGSYLALEFDCNDNTIRPYGCPGYCNATSPGTSGCSEEEVDFCNQDPCGFGTGLGGSCKPVQQGSRYSCVSSS